MSDDPYEKEVERDVKDKPKPPPPLFRRPKTTSVDICPVCSLDHAGPCDD